jgi:hypothetical protein
MVTAPQVASPRRDATCEIASHLDLFGKWRICRNRTKYGDRVTYRLELTPLCLWLSPRPCFALSCPCWCLHKPRTFHGRTALSVRAILAARFLADPATSPRTPNARAAVSATAPRFLGERKRRKCGACHQKQHPDIKHYSSVRFPRLAGARYLKGWKGISESPPAPQRNIILSAPAGSLSPRPTVACSIVDNTICPLTASY